MKNKINLALIAVTALVLLFLLINWKWKSGKSYTPESPVPSIVYTAGELDQLIHHGLTGSEVKKILGNPGDISKSEELVIYYYAFPAEKVEKKNGAIPIGINVMFIDDKVVNWGIVRVLPDQSP